MQVTNDNIFNLLSANMVYKIPRYQRQYSWQQAPQCEMLWQDVKAIIAQNSCTELNGGHERSNHFLGTIVTVELQDSADSDFDFVASSHLIDGQQRVTSLSLMIVALRRYIRQQLIKEPENTELKRFENTLSGLLVRSSDQPKLELSSTDHAAYASIIKNDEIIDRANKDGVEDGDSLLWKNCRYFFKCWRALFEDELVPLTEQAIKPMFECLQFAHIELEPEHQDNPQQVFESLNSTGMNLSQSDLIRNFLLMEMNIERQRALYNNFWRVLERNIESSAQNAQDVPNLMQQFFAHFMTIKNAEIPNEANVYVTFKAWFASAYGHCDDANQKCLQELLTANQVWCKMYWSDGTSSSLIERTCYELRQLERGVLLPVMFKLLYDRCCGLISDAVVLRCLQFLRSYSLRLFIQNEDVGNLLNQFFSRLIARLNKVQDEAIYLQQLLTSLIDTKQQQLVFPTDAVFRNRLINHNFNGSAQEKKYVKLLLFITERYENKEFETLKDSYALDFILPADNSGSGELTEKQGWDKDLLDLSGHQEWSGRLGNLTLHEGKPLPKAKAKWASFVARKNEFMQNYKRHLNQELLDPNKGTWTVHDIKARGDRLADLILQVLPYPDESLLKQ